MSQDSAIEWTDATWNPTTGCTKISPGCLNCYIARTPPFRMAGRKFVNGKIPLILHHDRLDAPLHWKKPRRVFVNSLSDLFHDDVPDEFIDSVFSAMGLCDDRDLGHVFQILTKRETRMLEYMKARAYTAWNARRLAGEVMPPSNVWLGVSVEDRKRKERIDALRQTPAAVRFLSIEPLLEDVGTLNLEGIHWVIVGGESGPGARPMHPDWARSIRDQCQAAFVRFFFKQWGEWAPTQIVPGGGLGGDCRRGVATIISRTAEENDGHFRRARGDVWMSRVGKKAAGRLLDGCEHNEFPTVTHAAV